MNPPPPAAWSASRSSHRWIDRALMANAVALVLAPWAILKLILLAMLLAGAASRLEAGVSWSAAQVRIALLGFGLVALVVSPYWAIAPTTPLRLLGLGANAAVVALWARSASSDFRLRPGPRSPAPWLVAAGMLLLCGPGVFGPLEFRGDEDVHVTRPLRVLGALGTAAPDHGALLAATMSVVLLASLAICRASRFFRLTLLWVAPIGAGVFFLTYPPAPEMLSRLARYPILGAWLQTILAFSPLHALRGSTGWIHQEGLYRLASFGSVLALALLTARIVKGPTLFRVGAAMLVGTLPTCLYFSGAAYPDVSAAVLSASGLLALRFWIRRAASGGSDRAAALPSLALATLLKESLAPFMVAVALSGGLAAAWGRTVRSGRFLASGLKQLLFVLLAPVATYVAWRFLAERLLLEGRSMRELGLDPGALLNPAWMVVVGKACLEQFGPLLPLAAIPLLIGPRRVLNRLVFLAPLCAQVLFLGAESVDDTAWGRMSIYAGLARFQLTLVPSIVGLAILGLRWLWARAPRFAWGFVALGLVWNLVARPVSFDGHPAPRWGDYVVETSGERYPYDALYAWIADQPVKEDLTVVGRDYTFRDDFYLKRHSLGIKVTNEPSPIPRSPLVLAGGPERIALISAHLAALMKVSEGPGLVVLHLSSWLTPADLPDRIGPFRSARSFCEGRFCLILYQKDR